MLVRIGSGSSGIKEYLETGRKKGREYDRDLIDTRLPIAGDMDVLESVIDSYETKQEGDAKYLHITLGFAEQFTVNDKPGPGQINEQIINAVTEEYRKRVMTAFDDKEYSFYAEAHIPKVTHEIHGLTGETIERLPHVHIVIPMRNLVTNKYLNPLMHNSYMLHNKAIQEVINQQFGLKSPDDSLRDEPISPLSKHNPDFEPMTAKQLKATVMDEIFEGRVSDMDSLSTYLEQFGAVRLRKGKDGDYLNVKPQWADKGINLKEFTPDKLQNLVSRRETATSDVPRETVSRGEIPDYHQLAHEWEHLKAFEARFVSSSMRGKYYKFEDAEKLAFLDGKLQERDQAIKEIENAGRDFQPGIETTRRLNELDLPAQSKEYGNNPTIERNGESTSARSNSSRADSRGVLTDVKSYQGSTDRVNRETGVRQGNEPTYDPLQAIQRIQSVIYANDHLLRKSAEFIERIKADQKGRSGFRQKRQEHRSYSRLLLNAEATRYYARSAGRTISKIEYFKNGFKNDFVPVKLMKEQTSPLVVLEFCKEKYAIDPNEYSVGVGRDGTPRIFHESKQYSVNDFFTKHLNETWENTKPMLKECYYRTMANDIGQPDKSLWKTYNNWRKDAYQDRVNERAHMREQFRDQVLKMRDTYRAEKAKSRLERNPEKKRAIIGNARATMLETQARIKQEREQAYEKLRTPERNAEYRQFLQYHAQNAGDRTALKELRRINQVITPDDDRIILGSQRQDVFVFPTYQVDLAGNVTYSKGKTPLVRDTSRGVVVMRDDRESFDMALKVAIAKYGRNLTFNGNEDFMKKMIEAAKRTDQHLKVKNGSKPNQPFIEINQHKSFDKKPNNRNRG